MSWPLHIVFTLDRRFLPGMHVTAYSVLASCRSAESVVHFHLFSESLTEEDVALLKRSLERIGRAFQLELHRVESGFFERFPAMQGSLAVYYRLIVPELLPVERFIYVDVDTVCDVDLSELAELEMGTSPAGLVAEAPLAGAVDRLVANQLGNSAAEQYYNAGLMVVNGPEWRRQKITEQCLDYLGKHRPAFHDQAALNFVLHSKILPLDGKFNCIANMRKNWPGLVDPQGRVGRLVHFVDYPKPWDFLGEWLHPQHHLWGDILNQTAMRDFRSWHRTPTRKLPRTSLAWAGYKKALKDRVLFAGYARGWLKRVKGVPQS